MRIIAITLLYLASAGTWSCTKPRADDKDGPGPIAPKPDEKQLDPADYPGLLWIYDAADWKNNTYHGQADFAWSNTDATPEGLTLRVQATDEVVTRTYLPLALDADAIYRFSADVKVGNVTGANGATITIVDEWFMTSQDLVGTADFKPRSMVFQTPADGRVSLCLSLGLNSNRSSGTAYFKNLKLEKQDFFTLSSQHLRLRLRPEDAAVVSEEALTDWLAKLDRVYGAYTELIGGEPYGGEPITILAVDQNPRSWAYAGNPIIWHRVHVPASLRSVAQRSDWEFGIMHEIAHDFCAGGDRYPGTTAYWNWNDELFANFRMYYALDQLNGSFVQGDKLYTGTEAKSYYRSDGGDSYENAFLQGRFTHDALMYTLIRIQEAIGWEPFRQTFRWLHTHEHSLSSDWERFDFFLTKLQSYTEVDVRGTYPSGELAFIQTHMN
ncbi:hypothetical protein [Parapedobacter sp. 2B3]|uniref:hypothetical protein n=1 Tax=Parapedobacter sp. 2B3 TaxID=3342381 RepID=UPI0035B661E3